MNEDNIKKPIFSKLVILSFLFGILGLIVFSFHIIIYRPQRIEIFGYQYYGYFEIFGFLLSILALIKIKKSKDTLKGSTLAIFTILFTGLLTVSWWIQISGHRSIAFRMECRSNLMKIGKAMLIYANDYDDQLPTPNEWCDLLLEPTGTANIENFICPTFTVYKPFNFSWPFPKKGQCYYAINPNCNLNSPPNTVLIFETEVGWNQFGGPEFLTTRHHEGQKQFCSILFNDGQVKIIEKEEIGDLKWNDEETNE